MFRNSHYIFVTENARQIDTQPGGAGGGAQQTHILSSPVTK